MPEADEARLQAGQQAERPAVLCRVAREERVGELDPDDRRRRLVRTTRTGTAALREARRITDRVGDDLLSPLPPELRPTVHAALVAVLEHARTLSS